MIDTHCHLLPGLDDGPRSPGGALELATLLVDDGVEFVLCTPHYSRAFMTDHGEALRRADGLGQALSDAEVPLRIGVAAEVSVHVALIADGEELRSRSIAGRFLLVELHPDTAAPTVATLCSRLAEIDLLPILAHPERSRAVQRHPGVLDSARSSGALVQVVAPSLTGTWGASVAQAAWHLLDTGRADLLASDAHGRRLLPQLAMAVELVSRRVGEGVARSLTGSHPANVIQGRHPSEPA